MNAINRFTRSWQLLRSSLQVIARNKILLVFPIVSFVCVAVMVLFFVAPAVLRPTGHSYLSSEHWQAIGSSLFTETRHVSGNETVRTESVRFTHGAMAYLALIYFVSMFCATFFNVAFFNEILAALTGQPVSIARGLKFACTRLKAILMWTLFAGVVGLIIKLIEQRLEIVGRILARIIGVAWSIASVFVIPVIVREEQNANPIRMLRTSATLLTRTWGEALIGYAGLAAGNAVVLIVSLVFLVGSLMLSAALHTFVIGFISVVAWLAVLFAWSYLTSVASQVYKGALYIYAAEGTIPAPYDKEMLDVAWKYKKR
jgi:hypothetical protein